MAKFKQYQASPDDCYAFMALRVSEDEIDDVVEAYCDECEERHSFIPKDE